MRATVIHTAMVGLTIGAGLGSTSAQQPFPGLPPAALPVPGAVGTDKLIDVNVSYSFNIPIKSDDRDVQRQTLEKARQMIYDIAAKECDIMQAAFAATCRMERINVQSNIQRQMPGAEVAHVTGNTMFKVGLKTGN